LVCHGRSTLPVDRGAAQTQYDRSVLPHKRCKAPQVDNFEKCDRLSAPIRPNAKRRRDGQGGEQPLAFMQISAMYLIGPQSFSANKVNQRRRADVNGSFLSQAIVFRDVEIAKHSKISSA
jgi:hypothetical protein